MGLTGGHGLTYKRVKARIVDKRSFILSVHANVNPFTTNPKKGWTTSKLKSGMYFNYKGNTRFTPAQLQAINNRILQEINITSIYMIGFWKRHCNKFFSRRAQGMYSHDARLLSAGVAKNYRKDIHKHRPAYSISRRNTNQLKNALRRTVPTQFGCKFYVEKCMRRGYDYVAVLIRGTRSHNNEYIPALDKRVKRGKWFGITNKYWERWWRYFIRELYRQEYLMNQRIINYLVEVGVGKRSDFQYIGGYLAYSQFIVTQEAIKMSYAELKQYNAPMTYMQRGFAPYEGKDQHILDEVLNPFRGRTMKRTIR